MERTKLMSWFEPAMRTAVPVSSQSAWPLAMRVSLPASKLVTAAASRASPEPELAPSGFNSFPSRPPQTER